MLTEVEVARYSRQILLQAVGGRGQERLLGARVLLKGSGQSLGVAGRYLAGSGMKVDDSIDRADVFPRAFAPNVNESPDLIVMEPPWMPTTLAGVLIGTGPNHPGIVYWQKAPCPTCVTSLCERLVEPPTGALNILLGTLAAWTAQCLWLGRLEGCGGFWIEPPGGMEPIPVFPCRHPPAPNP